MTTSSIREMQPAPRAIDVQLTDDEMTIVLTDGRRLTVPLEWFPRLASATAAELADWRIIGDGVGIHWESVDEDLSVAGLFRGTRPPSQIRS